MGACLTLMNPTPTPNTRSSELPLASGSVVQDLHVQVAVIGGGPAGLMAAQTLSQQGRSVHLFDGMPSVGRKFLLAGRGGLNLTHSEPLATFVTRFGAHQAQMQSLLTQWGPQDLRAWAADLGIETFVGSSGRVFPQEMKAAPLLRAWLHRLRHPVQGLPVQFHMRHRLQACVDSSSRALTQRSEGLGLLFQAPGRSSGDGPLQVHAQAVVLALGGASWSRLGSDGEWLPWLSAAGVPVAPLQASNCGFHVAARQGQGWTTYFSERFAGQAFKSVAIQWQAQNGQPQYRKGEFVLTTYGVEGSLIYAASADLREALNAQGHAQFGLDLLPDRTLAQVLVQVQHPRGSRSLSSHLKSRLGLEGLKLALLHELLTPEALHDPLQLAQAIKALPVKVTAPRPMDEAISTAGGVTWQGLTPQLQTRALPGVFCAGEMLDWEAPTGGYLLTAAMASGVQAGLGVHAWLQAAQGSP